MLGLAAAAVVRLAKPELARGRDPVLGAVSCLAAAGALVGLITGLTAG